MSKDWLIMPVDPDSPTSRSHLFTVRMWPEELGNGQIEWRGQVQHVLSGEARYFREWAGLVEFLQVILSRLAGEDFPIQQLSSPSAQQIDEMDVDIT